MRWKALGVLLLSAAAIGSGCATAQQLDVGSSDAALVEVGGEGGVSGSAGYTSIAGFVGNGGVGTGGVLDSGGTSAAGGDAPGSGGKLATDAGLTCATGQKRCAGACVAPSISTGCGAASCTACTAPTNGTAVCTAGSCDFTCASGYNKSGTSCQPAQSCTDKTLNGTETDVDCGGATCPKCAPALKCTKDADCAKGPCVSGICGCTAITCTTPPSCGASVDDGCGKKLDCSATCMTSETCYQDKCCTPKTCASSCGKPSDGCGKTLDCPLCDDGATCQNNADCKNGACESSKCVSCTDTKKNHGESDVDCGGANCPKCANNKLCTVPADCTSNNCCGLNFLIPPCFGHGNMCE